MNTQQYNIIADVRKDVDSRNRAITELYNDEKLLSAVTSYILKNGGQDSDVDDIFIFGIMVFIKQCARSEFVLNGTVNSYVFSVIRYEWMRRKKESLRTTYEDLDYLETDHVSVEHLLIDKERKSALRFALNQLEEKCRQILTMWASDFRMREIATSLDYKSEGMARKKKFKCLNKLKSLLKDINDGE